MSPISFREKANVLTMACKILCDQIPYYLSDMCSCFHGISGGRMFQVEEIPWSKGPKAGARLVNLRNMDYLVRVPKIIQR